MRHAPRPRLPRGSATLPTTSSPSPALLGSAARAGDEVDSVSAFVASITRDELFAEYRLQQADNDLLLARGLEVAEQLLAKEAERDDLFVELHAAKKEIRELETALDAALKELGR